MRICQLNIFLFVSYGGHFVHLSRTVGAILVEDIMMNHFCEIMLNLAQWHMRRCHLNVFLFLAMVGIMFGTIEEWV